MDPASTVLPIILGIVLVVLLLLATGVLMLTFAIWGLRKELRKYRRKAVKLPNALIGDDEDEDE